MKTRFKHPSISFTFKLLIAGIFLMINGLSTADPTISPSNSMSIPEQTLRVHYSRTDHSYSKMRLWVWEDTTWTSENGWPHGMEATHINDNHCYFDVPLNPNAKLIGLLPVKLTEGEPIKDGTDKLFNQLEQFREVWIRENDEHVYITENYDRLVQIKSAKIVAKNRIEVSFDSTAGLNKAYLLNAVSITPAQQNAIRAEDVFILPDERTVQFSIPIDLNALPYEIRFENDTLIARKGWRYIDSEYAYSGELGPILNRDGTATLKLWSPEAENVSIVLYDKNDQDTVVAENISMRRKETGVWEAELNAKNTSIESLNGYYYHYKVSLNGSEKLCLDPYAKSMAPFDKNKYHIGKAAIVDPAQISPDTALSYAKIDGFEKKEDAIIWEIHVRDLTVDPDIESELTAPFGTFEAVIDRLDYIQSLGVTHIQFLPVMSYHWGDELASRQREMKDSAQGNNYNWGYDPHSYFSLSGMYSADPKDPELRIMEFKNLVNAVHAKGMGVILDVVFNHTASVSIFEDLVQEYYHFMNADGSPRTSFGGGRLGTTHAMSRRILVDSIKYWTDEFKIDGFRFDMMGDHDAESIQIAYDSAKAINPNVIMIGEGWRTYVGDEDDIRQAADQDWMAHTDSVAVFSDEMRNELKSGYGSEGEPRFITGGARSIEGIFNGIKGQPSNFNADDPGDVVAYIAAHDNLTLHDVIAQSIKKDPAIPANLTEIHRRIRIGNALVLTSQGVAFLHAGQEYGRTKQWRGEGKPQHKETVMFDQDGKLFTHPYFIHDSYDSSDSINRFDWAKVTDSTHFPDSVHTKNYTAGLVALRRSTDAFRLGTKELVNEKVTRITAPEINDSDLVIAYQCVATNGDEYFLFINADSRNRKLSIDIDLTNEMVIVDQNTAGITSIDQPTGLSLTTTQIDLDPLTVVVIKRLNPQTQG